MSKIDDLDRAIKDAEIRLKSIQCSVEQLDKEIGVLDPRKLELERNIEFHKKSGTIPLAHEYKKSKSELSKVTARLILIRSDHKKASQACVDVQQIIEKFKRDHMALLKTNNNNVLWGLFGVNRGKK